jgi:hypothetical protein
VERCEDLWTGDYGAMKPANAYVVLVEVVPRAEVPSGRPGIRLTSGVLDVPKRGSGVEAEGHEGMPKVMRVQIVGLLWHGSSSEAPEAPPDL